MTVSRVINGRPDVARSTRLAVEAAVVRLGYQPNAVARSLVRGRSRLIGVVTTGVWDASISQILAFISSEAQSSGYGLLLRSAPGRGPRDLTDEIDYLTQHGVAAIVALAPDVAARSNGKIGRILPGTPPIVTLKCRISDLVPSITVDTRTGSQVATEHLILQGRRCIGYISGPSESRESRDRLAGWESALHAAGLARGPIVVGDWSSGSGATSFETMLQAESQIDAVIVANDQMALGALRVAHERGLCVPDDVAFVGFDGSAEAADFTPPLTSVMQPWERLGREGVGQALAAITGLTRPLHLTLGTELIIRASSVGPATDRVTRSTPADGPAFPRRVGAPGKQQVACPTS